VNFPIALLGFFEKGGEGTRRRCSVWLPLGVWVLFLTFAGELLAATLKIFVGGYHTLAIKSGGTSGPGQMMIMANWADRTWGTNPFSAFEIQGRVQRGLCLLIYSKRKSLECYSDPPAKDEKAKTTIEETPKLGL
jgi:hypothetical protein